MKKYIFLLALQITALSAWAQIPLSVTTEVLYPYPTQYSVWASEAESFMIIVTNNSDADYRFFVKTSLTGTDDALNETFILLDENYRPNSGFDIAAGETMMITSSEIGNTYSNLSQADVMISDNIPIDDINGELPSGDYKICTQLVEFDTDLTDDLTLLSPIDCSDGFGVGQANIQLEFPNEFSMLDPEAPIDIMWGVAGVDFEDLSNYSYRVVMYEVDSIQAAEESVYDLVESGGANVFFTSEPVNENVYIYDPSLGNFPLTEGNTYAIQIEVVETNGLYFDNNGKSNILIYDCGGPYGYTGGDVEDDPIDQNQIDCFMNCLLPDPSHDADLVIDNPESFTIGHFTMDSLDITSHNDGRYTGTGRIQIDWLNNVHVLVSFNNIRVNNQNIVTDGEVYGLQQEEQPTLLDEFNDMVRSARVGAGLLGAESSVRLPIGIDYNISGTDFLLALTEMKFTPNTATVSTACNFHMPAFGEDSWISLASAETCMHSGGFGNEFIMYMNYDRPISAQGDVLISFKGTESTVESDIKEVASYMQMDCNGLKEISLKADIFFPEEMIVPDTHDGTVGEGQVKGNLGITIGRNVDEENNVYAALGGDTDVPSEAGLHFIAQVSIDSFQIKNVEGWGFGIAEAYLDGSEYMNAPDMNFPDLYEGDTDELWTGFYIKNMRIAPPKDFIKGENRITAEAHDAIIDDKLTMQVGVANIFESDEGDIKDWSISMDYLYLNVVQNNLVGGGFDGKMGAPITGSGEFLDYSATISVSDNDASDNLQYNLTVNPTEDITMPFMMANATLADNSYISANIQPGNKSNTYIEFHPFGNLSIETENFDEKSTYDNNGGVPLTIPLLDFSFLYNSNTGFSDVHFSLFGGIELATEDTGRDMDFSYFDNGMESNTESLVGLPIMLERLNIEMAPEGGYNLKMEPHVILCPGEFGFGASTVLNFPFDLKEIDEEKKLKLTGFNISGLQVNAAVHGFNLEGGLEIYNKISNDELISNKGAKGNLKVILPMGLGFKMAAEFGSFVNRNDGSWNNSNNFQYWYVDGMIYFGNFLGVPIGGPMSIYGIGGGLSYNMTRSREGDKSDGVASMMANVADPTMEVDPDNPTAASVRRTGISPIPDFGKFGFKFASTIGITGVPSLFNADVSLEAEADTDDRLAFSFFSIGGDGFLMTPIAKRYNPKFWASVALTFENPRPGEFSIHGGLTTYLDISLGNFPILKGDSDKHGLLGPADFHMQNYAGDGRGKGYWYLHAGNPETPFGAKLSLGPLKASASVYAMLGHSLPTQLPMPEEVEELFGKTNSKGGNKLTSGTISGSKNRDSGSKQDAKDGTGLAFGAQAGVGIDIDALGIYAKLSVFMGFDINLTQSDSRTCFGGEAGEVPGINGWYGQGQIYAGLEGGLGFRFKFAGKKHDLELFGLSAAMMLSGGGPDPWWAEGRVGLQIRVLGGLVKCTKTISVRAGEPCIPHYNDPFGGVPMIANITPSDDSEEVSQFADVSYTFTFPMNEITEVPSIRPDGSTYTAYVEPRFSNVVFKKKGGSTIAFEEVIKKQGKRLDLIPDANLLKEKEYEVSIRIKAYEYPQGPGGPDIAIRDENGNEWYQDTTIVFTTGIDTQIDSTIVTSIPIRNQRYFLQDEVDNHTQRVQFDQGLRRQFFPQDTEFFNFSYKIRYVADDGSEPIEVLLDDPEPPVESLYWQIPELQNNTMYAVQLIKTAPMVLTFDYSFGIIDTFDLSSNADATDAGLESFTEVELASADVLPELKNNETALFTYFFKTSKHNTLYEKISPARDDPNYVWWSQELTLQTDEKFDYADIYGEPGQSSLINVYDPMQKTASEIVMLGGPSYTSYYQDKIDDKLWRFINQFTNHMEDQPTYRYMGLTTIVSQDLPDFILNYSANMTTRHTKQVLNYSDPLDDNDIAGFGGVSQLVGNFDSFISLDGIVENNKATEIHFRTAVDARADAEALYDFALDFESNEVYRAWIDNHYTQFDTHMSNIYPPSSALNLDQHKQYYIDFYHSRYKHQEGLTERQEHGKQRVTWEYD